MTDYSGWYVARQLVSGASFAHNALPATYQDVYFQWTDKNHKPTVNNVNITNVVAITGGPYPTKTAAIAAIAGDTNTTGQPGTGPTGGRSGGQVTPGSSSGHLPQLPNPLAAIAGFLSGLTSVNLWIRVAKVIIGGSLLIVGIAKMAGIEKGIVGTAVRVAPLL